MLGLVARRILTLIPMLFIVSIIIFGLTALIPGDAAVTLAGGIDARPEDIEAIRSQLNLDDPFITRYFEWLGNALHLDFGTSLYTGKPVFEELGKRIPVTLGLALLVLGFAFVISVIVGIISGLRPGSLLDRMLLFISSAFIAMPAFWVAMLLVVFFSVRMGWFPPFGYVPFTESSTEWLKHLLLPTIALSIAPTAILARQLRGGLADTMQSSFVRTAWAKGGSTRQVVMGHTLKNSAGPFVTIFGLQVAGILGGTVIIEQIFSIPGMGTYLLSSVSTQDVPVVQGVAILFVVLTVSVSLVVDIVYGYLNPKVRVS